MDEQNTELAMDGKTINTTAPKPTKDSAEKPQK